MKMHEHGPFSSLNYIKILIFHSLPIENVWIFPYSLPIKNWWIFPINPQKFPALARRTSRTTAFRLAAKAWLVSVVDLQREDVEELDPPNR